MKYFLTVLTVSALAIGLVHFANLSMINASKAARVQEQAEQQIYDRIQDSLDFSQRKECREKRFIYNQSRNN